MIGHFFAGLLALHAIPATPVEQQQVQEMPQPEQVLAIPDGLRAEFQKRVLETKSPEQRLYRLVDFMLKPEGLGLKYAPDATNSVAESYRTRQVNCMAFTLMAVALAREAGLASYAQQIDKVMAWDLTGDVVTQSIHANAVVIVNDRKYMLDIAVGSLAQPVLDYKISDSHLLALFYGNRAMRSLVDGRIAEAALWQREAIKLAPNDATLLNNAGVVQQRLLDSKSAEALYLSAVEINPKLNSAMANLVALYRQRGDIRKSNEWQQRSSGVLRKDPYYQFAQGRRNELAGDINGAIDYYKRAITLNKREHVFHFYLARAYFETGSMRNADSELSLARQLSDGADQQRYLSKQEALRRLIAKKE